MSKQLKITCALFAIMCASEVGSAPCWCPERGKVNAGEVREAAQTPAEPRAMSESEEQFPGTGVRAQSPMQLPGTGVRAQSPMQLPGAVGDTASVISGNDSVKPGVEDDAVSPNNTASLGEQIEKLLEQANQSIKKVEGFLQAIPETTQAPDEGTSKRSGAFVRLVRATVAGTKLLNSRTTKPAMAEPATPASGSTDAPGSAEELTPTADNPTGGWGDLCIDEDDANVLCIDEDRADNTEYQEVFRL